jgi:PAS domain S-box-containing protein
MSSINRRILVIDDNRAIHEDFLKILRPANTKADALDQHEIDLFGPSEVYESGPGFELDFACQGQEGLALVCRACDEGRPYAMAFVDVRMPPGWDGIETTARMWEKDPRLQIVICTAYSDYTWQRLAAKLQHLDKVVILKKPFDVIEVLQAATAFTEKWHLQRQVEEHTAEAQQEIAERKRLEEQLRAQQEAFRLLTDNVPEAIARIDRHLRFVHVNRVFQNELGSLAAERAGATGTEPGLPAAEMWDTAVRRVFEIGQPFTLEFQIDRVDGPRRFAARLVPEPSGAGGVQHVLAVIRDAAAPSEAPGAPVPTSAE